MSEAQQTAKVTPKGTKFLLYTPPGYPGNGPYPLLIVLHGQGALGDNLDLVKTRDEIPPTLIANNEWPSRYPFIVVSPQLKRDYTISNPADQEWPPELVDEVVEYVRAGYQVDPARMYITGLSQGAHGSYDYTAAFPEKIAAAVYISGVPDSTIACQVKDIPLWIFHGTDDHLVPTVFATGLMRALAACSPKGRYEPHLTMLYGRRHEGWDEVYNHSSGYNVYDWMLKFRKNNTANTPPYVSAGADHTLADRDQSLHLYGDAFDSDGRIAQVQWNKVSGPAVTMQAVDSRFLKLTDLNPGVYEFEFLATDDNGAQSKDRVKITIASGSESPAVTDILLLDGGYRDIATLYEGYVINPKTLWHNQINLRPIVTGNVRSVRYYINGNQNARTNDDVPYYLAEPRWTVEEGEYVICATPFTTKDGTGTPGVSQCYKVVVSTVATPPPPPPGPKHFFARAGSDISQLSAWSSNAEGTGLYPSSFVADGQTFEIREEVTLNRPMTVGGEGTVFRIASGGKLTLNSRLAGAINMDIGAHLIVNSNDAVTFGQLHRESVVHVNTNTTLPRADYGHLRLNAAGTSKTLAPGVTRVAGDLIIEADVKLEGATSPSVLALSGNLTIHGAEPFAPATPFSIAFESGTAQAFTLSVNLASFHQITVAANTTVDMDGVEGGSTLEVGSGSGGGLAINAGGKLMLKKNHLAISGKGTLNGNNQIGQVGFSGSDVRLTSGAAWNSHLYTVSGADTIRSLYVELTAGGKLALHRPLYVTEDVDPRNGYVESNGYLCLVSTKDGTARLLKSNGQGVIGGKVVFQRFIPRGNQTRYLSFPVSGVPVSELQKCMAVTGKFNGATTGNGLSSDPSIHYYDEQAGGWIPYPRASNAETLAAGRGYSVLMHEESRDTKVAISGPVHQGEYTYALTPNDGNDPARGWALVGNPYAAPVQWNTEAWTIRGTSPAAYVLDDSYPGGRFLVWDGEVGDDEFGGAIAQGQAFFVRTTSATPVLNITEDAKSNSSTQILREKDTKPYSGLLVITLAKNGVSDRTFVKFSENGSDRFDESDAVKRKNGYFSLSSLSADSVSLAINHLMESFCDRTIALMVEADRGAYTLMFDGSGLEDPSAEVDLVDRYTDKVVKLKPNETYHFEVSSDPASAGKKRFSIQMPSGTLQDPEITMSDNVLSSNVSRGNQWLLNGEPIEGATAQTFLPEISGEYSLLVSTDDCSRTSDPVFVTVTVTGIVENVGGPVMVHPNPASHFIRIVVTSPPGETFSYTISNTLGTEVARGEWDAEVLLHGEEVNTSGLSSGVYFLNLQTRGWKYTTRFIVAK